MFFDHVPPNILSNASSVEHACRILQAAGRGRTIGDAEPVTIFVPPGTYRLQAPITITRHNVTLIVSGGARIIPPANVGAGNTNIVKYPEANYQSGAVTNNAGSGYKAVTAA